MMGQCGAAPASSPLDGFCLCYRYARMQVQASAQPEDGVMFDAVVPKDTSNAHVAAAGFYHCLGK